MQESEPVSGPRGPLGPLCREGAMHRLSFCDAHALCGGAGRTAPRPGAVRRTRRTSRMSAQHRACSRNVSELRAMPSLFQTKEKREVFRGRWVALPKPPVNALPSRLPSAKDDPSWGSSVDGPEAGVEHEVRGGWEGRCETNHSRGLGGKEKPLPVICFFTALKFYLLW